MLKDLTEIGSVFSREYSKTPKLIKIVDAFIVYGLVVAAVQFAYMFIFGSFPYNAFLGGFFCSIGFSILTVCFRMQMNTSERKPGQLEKVFGEYCVACLFLFFIAISYVG